MLFTEVSTCNKRKIYCVSQCSKYFMEIQRAHAFHPAARNSCKQYLAVILLQENAWQVPLSKRDTTRPVQKS